MTAELVYVNYGTREDHELLARYGVDLTGKIAIVRYGRIFRGLKPKLAAEFGAIGCIIYSDPADDGYVRGEVYPVGGYKNDSGVQRGSVMNLPLHAGDLLTPGWAAVEGAERLPIDEAPAMAPIPTLPISYAEAKPLARCAGKARWRQRHGAAACPSPTRLGAGPAEGAPDRRVRLEHGHRQQRRRAHGRRRVARSVGVARQPPRRLEPRRGRSPLRASSPMLAEAQAISRLGRRPARTVDVRGMGFGGARPHGLHRVGRRTRGRTAREGGALRQHRRHEPRLRPHRRQPVAHGLLQRSAARCEGPADRHFRRRTRARPHLGDG